MECWVLLCAIKFKDEPLYGPGWVELFSSYENARHWLAGQGHRIRWRRAKDNPHYWQGSSDEGTARMQWTLVKQGVDEALGEAA